jgi:hypothetical protein
MIPKREGEGQMYAEGMENLEDKVSLIIEGKHARIGLIVPETPPTAEDIQDLHRFIARMLIRNAQTKPAATEE